jgi:hypothetical protein
MCLHYILIWFNLSRSSSSPFIEQFQQVSLFYYTWIQNTSTTFALLYPFLMSSLLPLVPTPRQDLFYLPVLHLKKRKKERKKRNHFLPVYVSYTKGFLYIHVLYSSPHTPLPFLRWFQQVSVFHVHICIESTSTFTFFYNPSFPTSALLIAWPYLHSCPSLFRCLFIFQLGFLPWYFNCKYFVLKSV